ncbi:MAG: serine/threonine-protein kinase [Sandaracinaceae bacterium]
MSRLASLRPIGQIARYDVVGRLATGGMAEIFLARQAGPQEVARHLVVKRMLPHFADDERMVEMFVHEARLSLNLRHPHICAVYDFGDDQGRFYLAMEWVRGVSLRELLMRVGPLPIPFLVKVFADLAGALHHAHVCTDARGEPLHIVHRDVNPENLMVGFDGVAKLLDFGVAKARNQRQKTEVGAVKGKFAYISPEQYQGLPLDGRSDVFSLGVSLYEGLTGGSLYDRASEYETVAAIVLDPNVPSARKARPDVPADLDAIVQRAMAKDRDHRYPSADALAMDLEAYLARRGLLLRHADVASTLAGLVPELAAAEPKLDRKLGLAPTPDTGRHEPVDRLQAALLAAEADEDAEALLGRRRRTGRWLGWVSALLILVSLGVVGWVVLREPVSPPPAISPAE